MQNIPLFKVFIEENCHKEISKTIQSGFIGQGQKVEDFEVELQNLLKYPFINTTNSATSAIHLALHLIKEFSTKTRNQVITTPLTCTATNIPILHYGMSPVWADINPMNCNIDIDDVHKKIDKNTLAVMVVHWAGYPVDMDKINDILDHHQSKNKFRPFLIEDCSHAIATRSHYPTDNNFAVYSFGPIKHLTTGDGGCLVSPNEYFHKKAKLLRWYGLDRTSKKDFRCEQNIEEPGYKFHMNDINATIGLQNIKKIHDIVNKHRKNADYLRNKITQVTHLEHEKQSSDWILTVHVKNRDQFVNHMSENGIQTSRVHDRNDKHTIFNKYKTELPKTTQTCDTMICIPCGWWLNQENLEHIVNKANEGDWKCSLTN